jgi:phospholipid/cholesterol/gamma-HCH transport system substrate-binding protein
MPEETKDTSRRSNVVTIFLAAAGILGALAILFTILSGYNPFASTITVTTYFKNSLGLKSGAVVNLNGVAVGIVKTVALSTSPDHRAMPVLVTMTLRSKYLPALHTDSTAEMTSMGALADTFIDIDSQHATGPPPQDGAELPTLNTPTVLNLKATQDTEDAARKLIDRLNPLVDEAMTGKGSIGQLMSNPGLTKQAAATVARVHQTATKLADTDSTAGKIINDHSIADKLADIGNHMQGLQTSVAKLSNGPLQANINTAQAQFNSLSADIKSGHGAVGMVTNDPAFKRQLNNTSAQAKSVVASIHSGNGTMAMLLSPDGTQVDLNKLQTESSTLATMIRQNPKKYLTIKIRLF